MLTLRRPPRLQRGRGRGRHVGSVGACLQQKPRGRGRKTASRLPQDCLGGGGGGGVVSGFGAPRSYRASVRGRALQGFCEVGHRDSHASLCSETLQGFSR